MIKLFRTKKSREGSSLIEVVVVLGVTGMLIGLALSSGAGSERSARLKKFAGQLEDDVRYAFEVAKSKRPIGDDVPMGTVIDFSGSGYTLYMLTDGSVSNTVEILSRELESDAVVSYTEDFLVFRSIDGAGYTSLIIPTNKSKVSVPPAGIVVSINAWSPPAEGQSLVSLVVDTPEKPMFPFLQSMKARVLRF